MTPEERRARKLRQQRQAYAARADEMRALARAKREADPERARSQFRQYYAKNPEAFLERNRKRRAALAAAGSMPERWPLFERDGWTCYLCGRLTLPDAPLRHPRCPTLDHVKPLSRGGTNDASNLRCACLECNARKHAALPT